MHELILTTNDNKRITQNVCVSKKHYNTLVSLEYCGGFKRFHISIYDINKVKGKSETDKVLGFLDSIFANKRLIKSYFN